MAKKADLLEKAAELKLEVTAKNTIAEIEAAIASASDQTTSVADKPAETEDKEIVADREATVAKAGKRSQKALDEAEAKAEKEARKEQAVDSESSEEQPVNRGPRPITRSKLERRSKGYRSVATKIDPIKSYSLAEAIKLATETSPVKFDASVEVHVRLGVDPRQADQNIRTTVSLPHGTGKKIVVAVFADESEHAAAKKAGADIVGDESVLKQLDKGELNFDILITTPQNMPKLGKYARVLGPRGLMPNPKSGTVSANIPAAVKDAKTGKVEYRVDKQAIVHLAIGKVSFGADKLAENSQAFMTSLNSQKPSSIKGAFVRSITVSTTMGPGIRVAVS